MSRVYKYPVYPNTPNAFTWPVGSIVRHVGDQGGDHPVLWVEHPDSPSTENRFFDVVGTGWNFDPAGPFVGTSVGDHLVWHVYEAVPTDSESDEPGRPPVGAP